MIDFKALGNQGSNQDQQPDDQPSNIAVISTGMTILLPIISEPIVVHVIADQSDGSFLCSVAASSHPSYQVGDYDIVVSEDQLRCGTLIDPNAILQLATQQ